MPRTVSRFLLTVAPLAAAVVWMTAGPSGQSTGQPSTKNGDWPSYNGDIRGSRYSPQAQITADNFNKLEVAWRFKTHNLCTRPQVKLAGTPLPGDRHPYPTRRTRRASLSPPHPT